MPRCKVRRVHYRGAVSFTTDVPHPIADGLVWVLQEYELNTWVNNMEVAKTQ